MTVIRRSPSDAGTRVPLGSRMLRSPGRVRRGGREIITSTVKHAPTRQSRVIFGFFSCLPQFCTIIQARFRCDFRKNKLCKLKLSAGDVKKGEVCLVYIGYIRMRGGTILCSSYNSRNRDVNMRVQGERGGMRFNSMKYGEIG